MKETGFSKKQFQCSVTKREETVAIETTTVEKKGAGIDTRGKAIARKNTHTVQDCTGFGICGVRTIHGRSATFDWSKCPLIPILNTSRNEP